MNTVIVGTSRGLGAALVKEFLSRDHQVSSVSRNQSDQDVEFVRADMSKSNDVESVTQFLTEKQPDVVIYNAAGGPYGEFEKKNFKDHWWSLQVSLHAPMQIAHFVLNNLPSTKMIFIGSAIAESGGDQMASSYAVAKAGLRALFESVRNENDDTNLRLVSPGYMDTPLLPSNSWPRQNQSLLNPETVAIMVADWVLGGCEPKHLSIDNEGSSD